MTATSKATATDAAPAPQRPYDLAGGEEGLRRLVDRFYAIMDSAPEAAGIRAMHGADLGPVSNSLFEYLSGWLGGPPLYSTRTGSVCLTAPHRPFAIGESERDQWLFCMRQAMVDLGWPDETRALFDGPFFAIADFVRNR
jgi:hemoglobin